MPSCFPERRLKGLTFRLCKFLVALNHPRENGVLLKDNVELGPTLRKTNVTFLAHEAQNIVYNYHN